LCCVNQYTLGRKIKRFSVPTSVQIRYNIVQVLIYVKNLVDMKILSVFSSYDCVFTNQYFLITPEIWPKIRSGFLFQEDL